MTPETDQTSTRSRDVLRTLRTLTIVVVLAGAAATTAFVLERDEPGSVAAPANPFKTAEVTAGNLTTTEKIDGTFQLSSSLAVLHRIEGQTSIATTSPAASTAARSGAAGAGFAGAATAAVAAVITDVHAAMSSPCRPADPTTTTAPEATTTTTTMPPTGVDCPSTTPGTDPAPATTTPATTTSATTTPATTTPAGTTPAGTDPTDATTTTVAAPAGGGRPTGQFSGRSSAAPATTGSSGTGSGAATTRVTQVVTSVIADGSTVGLGDVLYSVESQPVIALSGTLPAWRSLSTSSADGPDIQQLESSLVSLGYDPDATVAVDDTFDSHTKAMVERWQTGLGVEATGTVTLGSVVFLPLAGGADTTTVTDVTAAVGDAVSDGSTIVTLTAATQRVVIDVPDGDETFIVPGLSVALGSGGATGTVALLRSVERDGAVVVQATIVPDAPLTDLDNGATLKVTVTTDALAGVLVAPAQALLSHLDGTYAVQVQAADGTVSWHTVELLGVSGSKVAIRGDGIAAGTVLLVPA